MSLRLRLSAAFAGAVLLALVLFGASAIAVLGAAERREARAEGKPEARADQEVREETARVLQSMAIAAPVAVLGAAALGFFLAGRALRPLAVAAARARAARASELDLTLPEGAGAEWDALASTLNALLADARASMRRIRDFTADAAHELRTPLTAIIGEADVALRKERTGPELRASLALVRDEATELARLVEALLTLARADAGTLLPRLQPAPLDELVSAAARPGDTVRIAGAPAVRCDRVLLARALRNLVDNAHIHGGGRVEIDVTSSNGSAVVVVRDHGRGIEPSLAPRLFERFNRGDASRASPGTGLGLALTRAVVEAHGGSVGLLAVPEGAAFEVRLPVPTPGSDN